jgi:hypothetical protein
VYCSVIVACVCVFLCSNTVLQSMKLGIDVNRHKEIIVKAIAALLILLLKMFKLNHMYQVEHPTIVILSEMCGIYLYRCMLY